MLDYKVQRDCNLTAVGTLLDNKGYGIGTPIGSPWRDKLSLAILDLQEKGEFWIRLHPPSTSILKSKPIDITALSTLSSESVMLRAPTTTFLEDSLVGA